MSKTPKPLSKGEETFALHCRAKLHPVNQPVREYVFAPPRKWRFDFAWPEKKVAAEIEGGTWGKGRHTSGRGFENDCHKYNQAALLGWKVFRFTTAMVKDLTAINTILEALK